MRKADEKTMRIGPARSLKWEGDNQESSSETEDWIVFALFVLGEIWSSEEACLRFLEGFLSPLKDKGLMGMTCSRGSGQEKEKKRVKWSIILFCELSR